jgi:hypothetical protein
MLRTLQRAWKNYVAGIPKSEVVDSIPESQWNQADLLPAVSKAKRKAFTELLVLIFAHLPPNEAAALAKRGASALTRADEVDTALRDALLPPEDKENSERRGFIACDWKAAEEVKWQADLLCQAHRIPATWQAPEGDLKAVLQNLDFWLQQQRRQLLCFSVGDSLVAFTLPMEHAVAAVDLGKKFKLAIRTPGQV